jgi:hypothetical protein
MSYGERAGKAHSPTAAPKEGRELSDSVVGVLSIVPPRVSHPSAGRRISECAEDTVSICSHTMDLMERRDTDMP